ncbi:MAG TPA: hypothetical protein PKD37_06865 [Oligoflexia bacterium]|nr:hypothetical protein [Oligoflexia bacterium]HMP27684.1 hypothetical protein [Oligoflexia bacterium]
MKFNKVFFWRILIWLILPIMLLNLLLEILKPSVEKKIIKHLKENQIEAKFKIARLSPTTFRINSLSFFFKDLLLGLDANTLSGKLSIANLIRGKLLITGTIVAYAGEIDYQVDLIKNNNSLIASASARNLHLTTHPHSKLLGITAGILDFTANKLNFNKQSLVDGQLIVRVADFAFYNPALGYLIGKLSPLLQRITLPPLSGAEINLNLRFAMEGIKEINGDLRSPLLDLSMNGSIVGSHKDYSRKNLNLNLQIKGSKQLLKAFGIKLEDIGLKEGEPIYLTIKGTPSIPTISFGKN